MIIFYASEINNDSISLYADEHMHCTKVLRKKIGEKINITDGKGNLYITEIENIAKTETICKIIETNLQPYPHNKPAIAISALKNPARLEWFVEKAVEIGISELIIFSSARTEKKSVNKARFEKIMISAMKQSLNFWLPELNVYETFEELISGCEKFEGKYLAWCGSDTVPITDLASKKAKNILLIGPEGDFTDEEVKSAVSKGFNPVSLGESRLRSESAGLVGLVILTL